MCTLEDKMASQRKPYFFSERFESPRETSNLEKSDGLVHCSVENAVVLCENYRERVTQIWTSQSEGEEEKNILAVW